jgi:lysine 6-dehydrogenase
MKNVTLLGAGMVGSAIAKDLGRQYSVTVADNNHDRLERLKFQAPVQTLTADLSNPEAVRAAIWDADLVIGALPGFMGFETLKTVIEAGKNIVDISFFGENPFLLDASARKNRVTAVVDFGVAPGMSNLILGFWNARMRVESFECLVGGLPVERTWPFQYKAPFSPADVLEEYTRPARLVENGTVVTRPALSESEFVEFERIGTLEAFNTDGLRTLIETMKIPFMKEKTLRYPGHVDAIRLLRDSGFLDTEFMDVPDGRVRPIAVTARLLFSKWNLREGEPEFTVMRITLRGEEGGKSKRILYHLLDHSDPTHKVSSMARTTGYACTAAARLVLEGKFKEKGIVPPERIGGSPECFNEIMNDLSERGVVYKMEEHVIEGPVER